MFFFLNNVFCFANIRNSSTWGRNHKIRPQARILARSAQMQCWSHKNLMAYLLCSGWLCRTSRPAFVQGTVIHWLFMQYRCTVIVACYSNYMRLEPRSYVPPSFLSFAVQKCDYSEHKVIGKWQVYMYVKLTGCALCINYMLNTWCVWLSHPVSWIRVVSFLVPWLFLLIWVPCTHAQNCFYHFCH